MLTLAKPIEKRNDAIASKISYPSLLYRIILAAIFMFASVFPTPETSALSFVLFVVYALYLLIAKPTFCVKYLYVLFGIAINILGVGECEFFVLPLGELSTTSSFAGSLPLIIFARWIFVVVLEYVDLRLFPDKQLSINRKETRQLSRACNIATIIISVVFCACLIDVMRYPSAQALGIDRFTWKSTYSSPFMPALITDNLAYAAVIPLMSLRLGKKSFGAISLILLIMYYFWTGSKFGPFLIIACVAALVFYDLIAKLNIAILRRLIVCVAVVFAILISFAALVQTSISSTTDPNEYLFARLAQQGQLWWSTYDLCNVPHPEEFANEIDAAFFDDPTKSDNHVGSSQGLYMIMYLTAPSDIVDAKLSTGSSYTEAGYAAMYYYFGPIGVILFSIILAPIIAFIVSLLLRAIRIGRPFDALILVRLMVMANMLMASLHLGLFGKVSIASIVFLIVLNEIRCSNVRRLRL